MCPSPSAHDTCPFLFVSTVSPPPIPLIKSHSFYKAKLLLHLIHQNFKISVQLLSRVWLFATPWIAAHQASLSISKPQSLLKLISIKLVMPSNPSHPLLSSSPPAFKLSQHQGLFQWVSSSHQVAKVLEFQLPMNIQNWFPLGLTTLCANSLQPHGQQPANLFGPWNSPDKTTGMGSHSLLQGIFLTQGWDQPWSPTL